MITEKQLAIHVTTRCTLNCKLCATMMPTFRKRGCGQHVPAEVLKREIDGLFEIYDFIENLTFSGGEPLFHPNVFEVAQHCLTYQDKFSDLRIFTNGTIIPDKKLLDLIENSDEKLKLVIDNYGPARSVKVKEISVLMEQRGLELRIINYHGEMQHYGGWVDYGHQVAYKEYTEEQVKSIFDHCHLAQYRCPATLNGRLHNCSWSTMLVELGYIPKSVGLEEFVDIFDDTISLDDKKRRVAEFGKQVLPACSWCNGFDPANSPRYPAAEQL